MIKLQPLRIPAGWEIVFNKFMETDIEDYPDNSEIWMDFTEDILYLKRKNRQYLIGIDLGWYPDMDPSGAFHIKVIVDENWSEPVREYVTRKRKEAVDIIENLLLRYCGDYNVSLDLKQPKKMVRLSREEIHDYVEKIRMGLGSDQEVGEWISQISASVPNRDIIGTIMSGNKVTTEEIVDKLYQADIIYL